MGMFDNTYGAKSYTPATLAAQAGKGLADVVGGALGMEHEEDRVLSVMQSVNPDNLDSVIAGYKKIMAINPDAAVEFKAQMMPFIKSRQAQTQLDTTAAQARKTATPKQSTFMANVEYNKSFVKQQNPEWTDLQVEEEARRLAKDKGVNVADQEEMKLFHTQSAKQYADLKGLNEKMNTLNQIIDLNKKVKSGIGVGTIYKQGNRLLEVFGFNVDEAADAQEFDALTTQLLVEQMSAAKGPQTDMDEERFQRTLLSTAGTEKGNENIAKYLLGVAKRQQDEAKERARFTRANKTNKTPGFNTQADWLIHLDGWRKENNIDFSSQTDELIKEGAPTETTDKPKIPTTASVNDSYAKFKEAKKKQIEELNQTPVVDNRTPFEKYGDDKAQAQAQENTPPTPSEVALAKQLLRDTGATQQPQQAQPQVQSFQQPIQNYQQPQVQPQPQQYQGLLTNGNISALDAVKNAVLNGPSPTGLLQQRMQQTSTDQLANRRKQQEVMQQKARFRQAQQKQAENTNGKPITAWNKVRVQKLSAQEREMWKDFIKSIPADVSGKRPKGWLVPFQKMICENRPECTL
jgi:hypothetical protein